MVASASSDETVRLWDATSGAGLQTLEDCLVKQLVFARDGSNLETDRGLLYIESDSASSFTPKLQPPFLGMKWITQDNTNLLWLPPEYWTNHSAFKDNLLVLVHSSGKITFIEFSIF
jgi:WD40 repeat protein